MKKRRGGAASRRGLSRDCRRRWWRDKGAPGDGGAGDQGCFAGRLEGFAPRDAAVAGFGGASAVAEGAAEVFGGAPEVFVRGAADRVAAGVGGAEAGAGARA
jgi:hypothetical protein